MKKQQKKYIYIPFGEILFSMAIFLEIKQELEIERVGKHGLFTRTREHKKANNGISRWSVMARFCVTWHELVH